MLPTKNLNKKGRFQSHLMDYILGLVSIMDVFLSKQKLPISEKWEWNNFSHYVSQSVPDNVIGAELADLYTWYIKQHLPKIIGTFITKIGIWGEIREQNKRVFCIQYENHWNSYYKRSIYLRKPYFYSLERKGRFNRHK